MSAPLTSPSAEPPARRGVKLQLKQFLQGQPALWSLYWRTKQQLKRSWMLRYFLYDIRHTYRAMFWHEAGRERTALSAELYFQYHKLEKGLVMPGPRRFFGRDPSRAVIKLARRWRAAGHAVDDPVYLGALETLRSYRDRLSTHRPDETAMLSDALDAFLTEAPQRDAQLTTPRRLPELTDAANASERFHELAQARRSVREFLPTLVDEQVIRQAVATAQLAPSACNRQPCKVYVVSTPEAKQELLALQNGNRGFGHLAPHVAIVTADERCFFDASERHEPYIDGGLFTMSFILALRAAGVASCCLNWCVPPSNDAAVHRLMHLPQSQRILMLVAFGYPPAGCVVPRSPRRSIDDALTFL